MTTYGVTAVVTDELLLPGTGSVVVVETEAVFEIEPGVCGPSRATIVTVAILLDGIEPRLQITVELPEHVPCVDLDCTKRRPGGSTSLTVTLSAAAGPEFVTVSL